MALSLHGIAVRYFVEVARTGSISDASARLHVAVSAISRQIARLEGELGVALFERRPRGMSLSEAGERLLAYAQRSLLEAEHVMKEIGGLAALHGHDDSSADRHYLRARRRAARAGSHLQP